MFHTLHSSREKKPGNMCSIHIDKYVIDALNTAIFIPTLKRPREFTLDDSHIGKNSWIPEELWAKH